MTWKVFVALSLFHSTGIKCISPYLHCFALVMGYYFSKAAIGFGRQKGYQPIQPIYYSHKVHAGINQISCLYCHGAAWESKQAAIPSVNICMNCHKAINDYTKGPKLYDEDGDEINGTLKFKNCINMQALIPRTQRNGIHQRQNPLNG